MKYSLTDFFTSIVYVFVIFMPGGIFLVSLLYLFPSLRCEIGTLLIGESGTWLLFIAASYLIGHLISLVGKSLEDWCWDRHNKIDYPELNIVVQSILKEMIPAQLVQDGNTRRWAAAILRQKEPPSYREVERRDADRRFFRNICVVLVLISVLSLLYYLFGHQEPREQLMVISLSSFALVILSYFNLKDQNQKYTKTVYESLIAMQPPKVPESLFSGREYEKRFLVIGDCWRGTGTAVHIRQGYLSTDKERVVRVRIEESRNGKHAALTIKGRSVGGSQPEYEYQIPVDHAEVILGGLCRDYIIEKTRHAIIVQGLRWEVDEFEGMNKGLVLAEIEAESDEGLAKAETCKPAWVGRDISTVFMYRNSQLTERPFTKWSAEEKTSAYE